MTLIICPSGHLRTYPPGPLKLSILPKTQLEYCQVEYLEKYSTFSTCFIEWYLSISWNAHFDDTQVEYMVKYSTWVDQADSPRSYDFLTFFVFPLY